MLMQKAHVAVAIAIQAGKITRPSFCEQCQKPGKVCAHHHLGYEPEYWFDVQWLCPRCHGLAEAQKRIGYFWHITDAEIEFMLDLHNRFRARLGGHLYEAHTQIGQASGQQIISTAR